MLLSSALIHNFKSIEDSSLVKIEKGTTVLVGKNESGKTAFLQALVKARDVQKTAKYNTTDDYPRKNLNRISKIHGDDPIPVATLGFVLASDERETIEDELGIKIADNFELQLSFFYNADFKIPVLNGLNEPLYVEKLISGAGLSSELAEKCAGIKSIAKLLTVLAESDKNEHEAKFEVEVKSKFNSSQKSLNQYVWEKYLKGWLPFFFYFDDYYLLPGKVNLEELKRRKDNKQLSEEDKTVLSLLSLADVSLEELRTKSDYETSKAKLEGISNDISDTILKFWPNPDLSVEFDVDTDPKDAAPFNNGQNLYIRIKNSRHRVTLPFSQRSRGFVWFFSFIVWFDVIQEQLDTDDDLILLLDEPGLNLHGLAQRDLLRYLDSLADDHQVIFTTHSPFMVHSDRLHEVRTVEDREQVGTVITSDLKGDDQDTLFPLQAALGYTIAQNLFISKRNLLVEGPADLIFISYFNSTLEEMGRINLRSDVTVVPTGGLDKLATFIALLKGNSLDLVVLHDYAKKPEQRIDDLVRDKIVESKKILNYALFRDGGKLPLPATAVEDLFEPSEYLEVFNSAYSKELAGNVITESDLTAGERIIQRIEGAMTAKGIKVRPSGGYNHYRVANHFITNASTFTVGNATLIRFEELFKTVNSLF